MYIYIYIHIFYIYIYKNNNNNNIYRQGHRDQRSQQGAAPGASLCGPCIISVVVLNKT